MKSAILFCGLFIVGIIMAWKKSSNDLPSRPPTVYCAPSFDPAKMNEANAPIFSGLGKLHFNVTTKNKKAQQYFDQGLTLMYAFNHGEAGRSFKAAIRHDSTFAMAYWGLAMILGPNYNAALNPASLADINAAMNKAIIFSSSVSSKEKALIAALAKRFPKEDVTDMTSYNTAYADAMKEVYETFPEDPEIIELYADALMNEHAWNLWLRNGTAQPWTPKILAVLENGLKKFPTHPGMNHSYIHAIEASATPEKGLPSANLLADALPAAGHLVHMPAHIYIRTGDYHKGVLVTEAATVADSTYVAQCKVQGAYPLMYYPHNIHFLAACAFFEGNSKKALDAAWMVNRKAEGSMLAENVSIQHYYIIPWYVLVQMGRWDDIFQLEKPAEALVYPSAIWHYARGMAYAAKGRFNDAEFELRQLKEISENEILTKQLIWDINSAADLVNIATHTLTGEIAMHKKLFEESFVAFRKAVALEDKLMYQEPPDWFFSVRHSLGHALLQAGRFEEAEKTYEEDLFIYRENGWALMGLYKSLEGQHKKLEAESVKKRFDKAWAHSDMSISSSRKY
ncbi:MAG: hypothetical protein H7Y31_12520 [Chitinophagaceae bacterium]|nr:hypothetical protein [Chitinophagaceae bacterium]